MLPVFHFIRSQFLRKFLLALAHIVFKIFLTLPLLQFKRLSLILLLGIKRVPLFVLTSIKLTEGFFIGLLLFKLRSFFDHVFFKEFRQLPFVLIELIPLFAKAIAHSSGDADVFFDSIGGGCLAERASRHSSNLRSPLTRHFSGEICGGI